MASVLAPDGILILDPSEHLGKAAHLSRPRGDGIIQAAQGTRPARAGLDLRSLRRGRKTPAMTIARRLMILLAVPLLILIGIGIITRQQMARIEERTRFVAESRVVALARLGNISRTFAELRVNVRSFLLATEESARAAARKELRRRPGRT